MSKKQQEAYTRGVTDGYGKGYEDGYQDAENMKDMMSVSEYVDAYMLGLHATLEKSHDGYAHIEDLTTGAAIYADSVFQFVGGLSIVRTQRKTI